MNVNNDIFNVLSESFDALESLKNGHLVKLPYPNIKPLDNINKARALLPPNDPNFIHFIAKPTSKTVPITEPTQSATIVPVTNNSNRHTSSVLSTTDSTAKNNNDKQKHRVIDNIAFKFTEGPLSLMKKALESKCKVKVLIRGINSIRGHCIGYLIAFDKHWNIILRDADEEYWKFKFPISTDNNITNNNINNNNSSTNSKPIKVKKKKHYGQLFIKGDTIVSFYIV
ncbi:putative small nuclear ribonucleoparticle-associated protein [Tieghemostelium lacteum]|uniref:Putative small nuclear ribonucleoparticle-associated protein n=1 Tax=Tieghemostelium lacteum TaxID=361077 RepID=A0A151Z2U8_TIELA|nr:putative small nuclear ribonucleoparticle-associated protein [Tieghemostelium lacteum]|eukprot:KYQ88271.1 putative small nuclear ribonucleoparticle-associated protein [Tieghemostelium lacteum]